MALDIHPDLPPDTVPRQIPGYEIRRIPCCIMVKPAGQKNFIKLNDTGLLILEACTGEWNVGEIIEALEEAYPEAADRMARDVFRALDDLKEEGLVTLHHGN
jgi:hypothetical protein